MMLRGIGRMSRKKFSCFQWLDHHKNEEKKLTSSRVGDSNFCWSSEKSWICMHFVQFEWFFLRLSFLIIESVAGFEKLKVNSNLLFILNMLSVLQKKNSKFLHHSRVESIFKCSKIYQSCTDFQFKCKHF